MFSRNKEEMREKITLVRSILFNIIFWPLFSIYLIVTCPVVLFLNQKWTYRLGYKAVNAYMCICLKVLAGIDYRVYGLEQTKELMKKGPIIIGCNHQSAWETFIFARIFDVLSIVIKKELLSVPVAGVYFKSLGCIPVDRSSPVRSIKDLMKYGAKSAENGVSILIFANGTRASYEEDVEYKSGLYAMYRYLKIPVVPACVDSGKCWSRRAFKKNPGTINLKFLEVIEPGLSKEEFMTIFKERLDGGLAL